MPLNTPLPCSRNHDCHTLGKQKETSLLVSGALLVAAISLYEGYILWPLRARILLPVPVVGTTVSFWQALQEQQQLDLISSTTLTRIQYLPSRLHVVHVATRVPSS